MFSSFVPTKRHTESERRTHTHTDRERQRGRGLYSVSLWLMHVHRGCLQCQRTLWTSTTPTPNRSPCASLRSLSSCSRLGSYMCMCLICVLGFAYPIYPSLSFSLSTYIQLPDSHVRAVLSHFHSSSHVRVCFRRWPWSARAARSYAAASRRAQTSLQRQRRTHRASICRCVCFACMQLTL